MILNTCDMHDTEIEKSRTGVHSSGESQSLINDWSYVDLLKKNGDCDCFGMWELGGLAKIENFGDLWFVV